MGPSRLERKWLRKKVRQDENTNEQFLKKCSTKESGREQSIDLGLLSKKLASPTSIYNPVANYLADAIIRFTIWISSPSRPGVSRATSKEKLLCWHTRVPS